jgi:hypothetical protein
MMVGDRGQGDQLAPKHFEPDHGNGLILAHNPTLSRDIRREDGATGPDGIYEAEAIVR